MKNISAAIVILFIQSALYAQITEQYTGVNVKLNHIHGDISNSAKLMVCGDNGTVLRSTNSGVNWINLTGNGIPNNVNLTGIIQMYYGQYATTCGNSAAGSHIFATVDSGSHWTQVFFQSGGTALAIGCKLFVGSPVGGRWSIWRSDYIGQAPWDSTGFYLPHINNEQAWNTSILIGGDCDWGFHIGTNAAKIYRRIGSSWTIYSSLPETNIRIFNWTGGAGYIAGANLYHTSNYGATWQLINTTGSGNFIGMVGGVNKLWCIREDNKIYLYDSTSIWNLLYTAPNGNYTRLVNSWIYLYALRDNGYITRIQRPEPPLGFGQINSQTPKSFSLSQNYPNPFNPFTNIEFQIPTRGIVKLIVFNALGQEVQTLVNQELSPGTYKADFDGTNLPSGVYYYKLDAESYAETKKMVLIK